MMKRNKKTIAIVEKYFSKVFDNVPGEYMIAGGAALAAIMMEEGNLQEIKDYDLFFKSKEDFETLDNWFDSKVEFTKKGERDIVYQIKVKNEVLTIDLVSKEFLSYQNILDGFDIQVCAVGFLRDGTMIYGEDFEFSYGEKMITFNHFDETERSLWRVQKYIDKGFAIHEGDLSELIKEFFRKNPKLFKVGYDKLEKFNDEQLEDLILELGI